VETLKVLGFNNDRAGRGTAVSRYSPISPTPAGGICTPRKSEQATFTSMKTDQSRSRNTAQSNKKISVVHNSETFPDLLYSSPFQELMDCVDNFVLVLDPGLRVLMANLCMTDFFGYPECELIAKKLSMLVDVGDRSRIIGLARRAKKRVGGAAIFLTRSHTKFHVDFSISPLANADEKPRGYLLVGRLIGDNTTPQIASLPNSFSTRILQNLADPAFINVFPSRTICDCNEPAISVLGFRRDEFIGRRLVDFVASIGECDRNEALLKRIDKTYAKIGFSNERLRFSRKSGLSLLCDCISLPFFTADGSLSYKISILLDRSREEQREADFTDFIKRAKQLSSDLEELTPKLLSFQNAKRLSGLGFTSRQIEITRFITQGLSSKEIGFRLGIAESTVKNHLAGMYRKVAARSRIDFMRILNEQHISIS
jgi:DNA-binding CsgD family transcriptional regulator/PAS domain-containing protein